MDAITEESLAQVAEERRGGRKVQHPVRDGVGLFELSQGHRKLDEDGVALAVMALGQMPDINEMFTAAMDSGYTPGDITRTLKREMAAGVKSRLKKLRTMLIAAKRMMAKRSPTSRLKAAAREDIELDEARTKGDFRVTFYYMHDRPEQRGSTYGKVRKGTLTKEKVAKFPSLTLANSYVKNLVHGEYDDLGGYVKSIEVESYKVDPERGLVRRFVRRIGRVRHEGQKNPVSDAKMSMRGRAGWTSVREGIEPAKVPGKGDSIEDLIDSIRGSLTGGTLLMESDERAAQVLDALDGVKP